MCNKEKCLYSEKNWTNAIPKEAEIVLPYVNNISKEIRGYRSKRLGIPFSREENYIFPLQHSAALPITHTEDTPSPPHLSSTGAEQEMKYGDRNSYWCFVGQWLWRIDGALISSPISGYLFDSQCCWITLNLQPEIPGRQCLTPMPPSPPFCLSFLSTFIPVIKLWYFGDFCSCAKWPVRFLIHKFKWY